MYFGSVDGKFGPATKKATRSFQDALRLEVDGIVGNETYAAAMLRGFEVIKSDSPDYYGPNWPDPPDFSPLVGQAARQAVFGKFKYKPAGNPADPEAIVITDSWQKENIVYVEVPQLRKVSGMGGGKGVYFHKLGAEKLKALFAAWEEAEMLHLIMTWGGSWVPRFIRGSRTVLSNHAFGTAFDINAGWNALGTMPPAFGKKGSVRALVPIANDLGFYWGGHFKSRPDGMHFELAKL